MKRFIKILFLCIFLLLGHVNLATFTKTISNKTLSYYEILQLMQDSEEALIFINIKAKYDGINDKNNFDIRWTTEKPLIVVKNNIDFINCDFDDIFWFTLRNMVFDGYLAFYNTKIICWFNNIEFNKSVKFSNSVCQFVKFDSCFFNKRFIFTMGDIIEDLSFYNSKFQIEDSVYRKDTTGLEEPPELLSVKIRKQEIDMKIDNCIFHVNPKVRDHPKYFLKLNYSKFSNLIITKSIFNATVDLTGVSVSNSFVTHGTKYNGNLIVDGFLFDQINSRVEWNTLKENKLMTLNTHLNRYFRKTEFIQKVNELEIIGERESIFIGLIGAYGNFFNTYKNQSNRFSANDCFIRIKEMETINLKCLSDAGYGSKYTFNYLMNIFLSFFCDFGTNPFKAIIFSFMTIFLFSFIYVFFPLNFSTEKNKNSLFVEKIKITLQNSLSNDSSMQDILNDLRIEHNEKMLKYQYKNTESQNYTIFSAILYPFLIIDKIVYFFKIISLRVVNISSLAKDIKNKYLKEIFLFIIILIIFLFYILSKFINSFLLSLNVFSTLGFGQIPLQGVPRFLSVIEGFIGWFFLSIFSVSLISQLI